MSSTRPSETAATPAMKKTAASHMFHSADLPLAQLKISEVTKPKTQAPATAASTRTMPGQWSCSRYLRRTRVPLIFWLLSAPRKSGTMRSISSKYDDRAGVVCCEL